MSADRFELLAGRWLDEVATPEESAELLEIVRRDPQALRRLLAQIRLSERLRETLHAEGSGEALARAVLQRLSTPSEDLAFGKAVVERLRRPSQRRRRPEPRPGLEAWFAAAALLLIVLGIAVFARRDGTPSPPVAKSPPSPAPSEPPSPEPPPPPAHPPPVPSPPLPKPPPAPGLSTEIPQPPVSPPLPGSPSPKPPPPAPLPPSTTPQPREAVAVVQRGKDQGRRILEGDGYEAPDAALLSLPDGTLAELVPRTRLEGLRRGRIGILSGQVDVAAAKQEPGKPLLLTTAHGETRVLGTFIRLVVETASTRLDVVEGRVEFAPLQGPSLQVKSLESLTATATKPPTLLSMKPAGPWGSHWIAEPGGAKVDGPNRALLPAVAGGRIWSIDSWNLVQVDVVAAGEFRFDAAEGEREIRLRFVEHRDREADQGIEIAATAAGQIEIRTFPDRRILGSKSLKRRTLPFELELTGSRIRVIAAGQPVMDGPHGLGGFGIVRPVVDAVGALLPDDRFSRPILGFRPR